MIKSPLEARAPSLPLGVLDLCKRSLDVSAGQSLRNTIELAMHAEACGYRRYWISEHHTDDSSQASPEVLVPLIASRTDQLRVGCGGILLRYYSPLKVAETFLVLEALFPGRIDLGVCKGPGVVDEQTARALVSGNAWELGEQAFEGKVQELIELLGNSGAPPGRSGSVRARPWGVEPPPVWVLGSGLRSARLAAAVETPWAFALFFEKSLSQAASILLEYRRRFILESRGREPRVILAVSVVCDDTEAEAVARDQSLVARGYFASNIVGTPESCAAQIRELAAACGAEETLVATWVQDHEARLRLYSRLSEAWKNTPTSSRNE
jgi:luciferase family oxidoreductase group 1